VTDPVIATLSAQGYQPIFMPTAGLAPPDIYVFDKERHCLVRYGPLSGYVSGAESIVPTPHKSTDFGNATSSALDNEVTLGLLGRLMRVLGLGRRAINTGFHFAGGSRFRYEFRQVTSLIVERHKVRPLIAHLRARPKITFTIDKQIYIFGDIV
jgi:hypothetical protein